MRDIPVTLPGPTIGRRNGLPQTETSVLASITDGIGHDLASYDKTVRVWDASNGSTLLTYSGHTAAVRSVAWSPDGKRLVSASDDETVRVWLWL